MLRTEGLILLQHFKSDSNIRLAKRYLNDASTAMKQHRHSEPITTFYWVRETAYRLLRHWNIEVDRPLVDGLQMEYRQGLYLTDGTRYSYVFRQ